MTISGDYGYVADYIGGLSIVDVSDPHNPAKPRGALPSGRGGGGLRQLPYVKTRRSGGRGVVRQRLGRPVRSAEARAGRSEFRLLWSRAFRLFGDLCG